MYGKMVLNKKKNYTPYRRVINIFLQFRLAIRQWFRLGSLSKSPLLPLQLWSLRGILEPPPYLPRSDLLITIIHPFVWLYTYIHLFPCCALLRLLYFVRARSKSMTCRHTHIILSGHDSVLNLHHIISHRVKCNEEFRPQILFARYHELLTQTPLALPLVQFSRKNLPTGKCSI